MNSNISQLKEYQIRALHELGKKKEIALVGRTLVESGGTTEKVAKIILRTLVDLNEDEKFLKTLNLLLNLHNHD